MTCLVYGLLLKEGCNIINPLTGSILQTELLHPKCLCELVSHQYSLISLEGNFCSMPRTGTTESRAPRTTGLWQQGTGCHEPRQLQQPPTQPP